MQEVVRGIKQPPPQIQWKTELRTSFPPSPDLIDHLGNRDFTVPSEDQRKTAHTESPLLLIQLRLCL